MERAHLGLELLLQCHADDLAHGLLGEPVRERRPRRQHRRVVHRARQQVRRRPDAVDEADPQRVLGTDALAGEDHLHGVAESDDHRQAHEAAVAGVEAPSRILQAELGVRRGEAHVAGERQLEPPRDGEAVDRGQDRLVDVEPARDAAEAVSGDEALPELGRRRCAEGDGVGLQVRAGAEGLRAGTRQHGDARLLVGVEGAEGLDQRLVSCEVERVHLLRPVDDDQADGIVALDADVGHGRALLGAAVALRPRHARRTVRLSRRPLPALRSTPGRGPGSPSAAAATGARRRRVRAGRLPCRPPRIRRNAARRSSWLSAAPGRPRT